MEKLIRDAKIYQVHINHNPFYLGVPILDVSDLRGHLTNPEDDCSKADGGTYAVIIENWNIYIVYVCVNAPTFYSCLRLC